jgi:hypothetical protein
MARKPIGKVAMTPAERQRRRRKRLKAEQLKTATKAERKRQRIKNSSAYIPMPPGVTYWRKVTVVTPEGEREILAPTTQPYPSLCLADFEDAEIVVLLRALAREANRRRLFPADTLAAIGPLLTTGEETATSLLQARTVRKLEPGEGCTLGPAI